MVRIIRTQAWRPRRGLIAAVFLLLLAPGPADPPLSADRFPLARISHRPPAAAADTGIPAALRPSRGNGMMAPASGGTPGSVSCPGAGRPVGLLGALSGAPPGPSVATPCSHARLHRLATDAGGKCGLEIRDDRGVVVRLAAVPRRVVSLAPSLTEIVFLLGKGELLAGATRFCNHPPAASSLPRIGGMADPDVERIVSLTPDLVLCTTDGNPRRRVEALEEMGIPCFAAAPQDLPAVLATVERLGTLLGDAARGRAEAAALSRRMDAARAAAVRPGEDAPLALFVVSTSPVIVAGEGTFMDELLRLAGARNAARAFRGRYPRMSVEDLVAARPDAVFVAGMGSAERFPPEVTAWKEVPAFRDGAVFQVDGDLVTRPGPRLVTALEEISEALAGLRRRRGVGR